MRSKWVVNLLLIIIGLLFLVPLIWVLTAAFSANPSLAVQWPSPITINNFQSVLTSQNGRAFINSFYLSFGTAIVTVVLAMLAAYPLSRYNLRFKRPFLYTILFATGLPITAMMVPVYEIFNSLNMVDSLVWTGAFLVSSSLPYGIWMMKNFMDGVPVELEEAAWVDGASVLKALITVILPLMRPALAAIGIFIFVGAWGNFFVPFILIQTSSLDPASVTIYQFFSQYGMVEYGQLAAYSILYAIPVVVLYVIASKWLGGAFKFGGAMKA
ncbi:carbohydrate ABC transporter permease [Alicyclobacillus sendaiensis]|uniref:Carbohydrate ABC transporter permease n=1 Tax=Alicyclobacillus sendaiensis PA2 TaxID=3029425 RepID=A0ABT6Y1H4_ALISE|nr:carbohydrate ABC transporter permease [Alicyclobacillus sendaiensis]MDI9261170.1 carbohydrate ABC transporter permease [Alicyclobacillus sendaiensis PA2]